MTTPFCTELNRVRNEVLNLKQFKPSGNSRLSPQRRDRRFNHKATKIEEALGLLEKQATTPEEKQQVEELEQKFKYIRDGDIKHALVA